MSAPSGPPPIDLARFGLLRFIPRIVFLLFYVPLAIGLIAGASGLASVPASILLDARPEFVARVMTPHLCGQGVTGRVRRATGGTIGTSSTGARSHVYALECLDATGQVVAEHGADFNLKWIGLWVVPTMVIATLVMAAIGFAVLRFINRRIDSAMNLLGRAVREGRVRTTTTTGAGGQRVTFRTLVMTPDAERDAPSSPAAAAPPTNPVRSGRREEPPGGDPFITGG